MQWNMTTNNYGGYKMSNIDELEKIQELKEKGILSEEEFETEKAKILNVNSNSEKNIKDEQKKESKILKNKKIKHCKKCGAEIEEGATFCGKCGTRIKGVKIRNTIIIGCSILVIIFFIYDPQKKTVNNNNFYNLQGSTEKNDETGKYKFDVITILSN